MLAAVLGTGGCERATPPPRILLDRDLPVADLSVPQRFSISDPRPGYRLVEIDQTNVNVQLTQFADGQRQAFDAPARRDTPERGCAFTRGGTLELIVASSDDISKSPNRLHIRVTAIDATETLDVGTATAESGDPDGFLSAVSVGTLGLVADNGALLSTLAGHIADGKSIVFTSTAGSDSGQGYVYLMVLLTN